MTAAQAKTPQCQSLVGKTTLPIIDTDDENYFKDLHDGMELARAINVIHDANVIDMCHDHIKARQLIQSDMRDNTAVVPVSLDFHCRM